MDLHKDVIKYDLVWIGEVHGIRENYDAYKIILPKLARNGFKDILWEMPYDFSRESMSTEDGRISSFSIDFLEWIHNQIEAGKLDGLTLFGNRKPEKKNGTIDYEETMAEEMLEIIRGNEAKKYVILTGNYHMQKSDKRGSTTEKCIDYIEKKTELKILTIELKYSGGTFYNYGARKLPDSSTARDAKLETLEYGDVLKLNVGEAHAVFKNPTTL